MSARSDKIDIFASEGSVSILRAMMGSVLIFSILDMARNGVTSLHAPNAL